MRISSLTVGFLLASSLTFAATPDGLKQVREYRKAHEPEILREYMDLLSIPNLQADPAGLAKNAEFLKARLQKLGLKTELLSVPGSPSAVWAEWVVPGAKTTLTLYAHYDGVAVNPEKWTGHAPFSPLLRDGKLEDGAKTAALPASGAVPETWRIYARSATDDKAGSMSIVNAIAALKATGQTPTSNLRIYLDGEEEIGSPHLTEIAKAYADRLKADLWIIMDGSNDQSGRQNISYGARGSISIELTVYGPKAPLHSGLYGNWAPSPTLQLTRLLASMKDKTGRVLIPGFYDGMIPLNSREKKALKEMPNFDSLMMKEFGFSHPEGGGKPLSELLTLPSLNIRSLYAGEPLGGTSTKIRGTNIIPATATATIDIRLVKGVDKEKSVERMKRHMEKEGFLVLDREPTDEERAKHGQIAQLTHSLGNNAYRVDMNLPILRRLATAVQSVYGKPVVEVPNMGGTLPMIVIDEHIHSPSVVVPIANYDNNIHTDNENIAVGRLWDGIDLATAMALME